MAPGSAAPRSRRPPRSPAASGCPAWVGEVQPGSTHEITAITAIGAIGAIGAIPALYPAAAQGLPTPTDEGCTGAGIGIRVPFEGHHLVPGQRGPQPAVRLAARPTERANALFKRTWKALERATIDP